MGASEPSSPKLGRRLCEFGFGRRHPGLWTRDTSRRNSPPLRACGCRPATPRGGAPGSPPPTQRSRAPSSGRRVASLRPRLVGGAAHVTALRACGRCRFPQSPSEREETRWRLKAIRSGAPAIRIEPSPSTRFRRPGPSRPAPQASPPGPGNPHRRPSARPSPLRFPFSPRLGSDMRGRRGRPPKQPAAPAAERCAPAPAPPPPPPPTSGPIGGLRSRHRGSSRGRWAAAQAEVAPKTRLSSPRGGSSSRRKPPPPPPPPRFPAALGSGRSSGVAGRGRGAAGGRM